MSTRAGVVLVILPEERTKVPQLRPVSLGAERETDLPACGIPPAGCVSGNTRVVILEEVFQRRESGMGCRRPYPDGPLFRPPFTTGGSIRGRKVEGAWKQQAWKYIITPPVIKIPE
jgi:hypothetical protein